MYIHCSCFADIVQPPNGFQQMLTGEHPADVFHEGEQQLKFFQCKLHTLSVDLNNAGPRVKLQSVDAQRLPFFPRSGAAQNRLDS